MPADARLTHSDEGTVYKDKGGVIIAWDRVLTEREMRMINANPYQLFRHHRPSHGFRWWHRLAQSLRNVIIPEEG